MEYENYRDNNADYSSDYTIDRNYIADQHIYMRVDCCSNLCFRDNDHKERRDLIFAIFGHKKQKVVTKTYTSCVCQDCGHTWRN